MTNEQNGNIFINHLTEFAEETARIRRGLDGNELQTPIPSATPSIIFTAGVNIQVPELRRTCPLVPDPADRPPATYKYDGLIIRVGERGNSSAR
jgi:hypothetical protein